VTSLGSTGAVPPSSDPTSAFRHELRAWLDDNLTDRVRGVPLDLEAGTEWLTLMREWNATLADAGYAAVGWPTSFGGRDSSIYEEVAWAEEMHQAQAPLPLNPIGLSNIAPAIMAFGTDSQKERFLRPMLRGEHIWCQGFSEPDAGSDLASLSTTAVRRGSNYVVNGQKVWTTLGHVADYCELLVRTDPSASKHRGISCLLVPMGLPGIEVRPLVTITGEAEFCEVFFSDVEVPAEALLGAEHDGWRVAMATLTHERGGVAGLHLRVRAKVVELIALAQTTARSSGTMAAADPLVRQELAAVHIQAECLRLLASRAITNAANGLPPGPESSIAKLVWSTLEQDLAAVAASILGPDALSGPWARAQLYSRALTIAGGTTEVNKNVLAERILGLPRGPGL